MRRIGVVGAVVSAVMGGAVFFASGWVNAAAAANAVASAYPTGGEMPRVIREAVYSDAATDRTDLNAYDELEALLYFDVKREEIEAAEKYGARERGGARKKLRFSRACEPGRTLTIAAVGDVLLHQGLAMQGLASDFRSLWNGVDRALSSADVTYANLEGPTAGAVNSSGRVVADPGRRFDGVAYTSYPMFNYHPSLVTDIRDSGIDVVSTANNHSLDRRALGADRTIGFLTDARLPFTGTRTTAEAGERAPETSEWSTLTREGGITLAWIACTYDTNGIPDSKRQVLHCYSQREILLRRIRELRATPGVDAVVVTPHWGVEYTHTPEAKQKQLARDMVEAGATIVFGAHPHVLEPVELLRASDGREAYVIYSLGNFVSGQKGIARRTAIVAYVGLTKTKSGEVVVNGARHLPIYMDYGTGTPSDERAGKLSAKPSRGRWEESRALANRILSGSTEVAPEEISARGRVVTNPGCE